MITTAALKCSRYCLLLSETFVVNVLECSKLHGKKNRHKQMLHGRFNFGKFCTKWASGETDCHTVPAPYMQRFSRYLISLFRNLLKVVPRATLWTQHLRTVQYKNSQQFRLTPHTEHQCVPFCDYRKVHTQYMLNISLHFNPQPTPFTVTKYRHSIQLHILSVDTAI